MKPNNIIELITSFLKYNFLKKSDLEKLKKSDKAKNKKYLNIFENSLYTKIVHECDKDIKFENSDIRELSLLRSDGFVKLENFKFEFDRAYYQKILDDRNLSTYDQIGVSSVNDASKHFKDLSQILESQHVNNLCKSYLGDDVSLNHIRVERLEKKLSRKDVSGLYHHDQVGHRLKILVLLDDLDITGRCTSYVVGSHKNSWKSFDYNYSRYDEKEIENKFKISKFNGKKGDVFIFDTNGLHKRDENQEKLSRAVIFFDIASHKKCEAIKNILPDKIPHPFPIGYYREQFFFKDLNINKTLINKNKLSLEDGFYKYSP